MNTYNTIILLSNKASLTRREYKDFNEGDLIMGIDINPTELKRWNIADKEEAKAELAKCECRYDESSNQSLVFVEEYALMYCSTDEDGEFIEGANFDLASKALVEEEDGDDE